MKLVINYTSEEEMEQHLIEVLTEGESQWKYERHIKTVDQLWENFFKILAQNNVSRLNGIPLTEDEKSQIRVALNFSTFYDAGAWLSGENGVAQVRVQRTDASLGEIYLVVHRAQDIAGGMSTYQVVNQIQIAKQSADERNRRTDVSLLINGIPLIHIELKSRANSIMNAFHQIKEYDAERKFSGIYSMIQTFVISNGSNTQYFAAEKHYRLNELFLTTWVDEQNQEVRELIPFAENVLTIPMGHELVTDYTVLDSRRKSLIVMRPYQIHATKTILDAVKHDESGHIWHTTGSGKTLTSYKASKIILKRNSLDKVLFLIDRKDLDVQTTNEFQSYAANDTIDVEDTKNVRNLVEKLISGKREVIVTTSQKLNYLIKRYNNIERLSKRQLREREQLRALNMAYVVDECHRAVSSEQKRVIDRFFNQRVKLWYGFTGTPIFIAKDVRGDLAATTYDQYGPALHTYTIKEAINDGNVLPFHIEYVDTFLEDAVEDYIHQRELALRDPDNERSEAQRQLIIDSVNSRTDVQKEMMLGSELYVDEEHMLKVIDQILNRSRTKLGLNNARGQSYSAILSVNKIETAQAYYRLFKEVLAGNKPVKLSDRVEQSLVDFPRIAITYSLSEDQATSYHNQKELAEAIADYNEYFGTNFTVENVDAYNRDLSERLARKDDRFKLRDEQIDVVIVVDRLLTGFDAPALSTLFIDREVMPPHSLIQAFSRTNRLHTGKRANIVTLRKPETFREHVREAVKMYSGGANPDEVLAPEWEVARKKLEKAIESFRMIEAVSPDILSKGETAELKLQYAMAFKDLDSALADVSVYNEFVELQLKDKDVLLNEFGISNQELEHYSGIYNDLMEQLVNSVDGSAVHIDMEYELSSRYREEIDHNYIIALMDKYQDNRLTSEEEREVLRYIKDLKKVNVNLGNILEGVWLEIKANTDDVVGRRVIDILEQRKEQYVQDIIAELAKHWRVDSQSISYLARRFNVEASKDSQIGWNAVAKEIVDGYSSTHSYPTAKQPNRLNIRRRAQEHIYGVIESEVVPLR